MKNITLIFLGLVFFFACKQNSINYLVKKEQQSTSIKAGETFDDWLSNKIQKTMKENDIPAISIGIIRDGKLEINKGFGIMQRGMDQKVDGKTIYQIGSLSKTFTGIIANNLILEGKLDPENSINTYMQSILSEEANTMYQKVKLKNLLNHTAGIPRSASLVSRERVGNNYWINGYAKENLYEDINNLKLVRAPGTKWEYSNFAYAIVGYICEQASGESYETLLKKYVTDKFDMQNTCIHLNADQQKLIATPYMKEDRFQETKAFVMGELTPASALFSNVEDLSKLMVEQLSVYKSLEDSNQPNPLMLTNDAVPTGMIEGLNYGIGLFENVDKMGTSYGHGGDIDGFACDYRFTSDQNSGIVILTSSGGRWIRGFVDEIFNQLRAMDSEIVYEAPKETIARALFSKIKSSDFDSAISWYHGHKDSKAYGPLIEDEINGLGYELLGRKRIEDAIVIFKMNVEAFPNSWNAYDSLGEAYLAAGNKKLSIENYERSVELGSENKDAVEMLARIKSK